mgnify:FL=1|jgi:hypothetical protein
MPEPVQIAVGYRRVHIPRLTEMERMRIFQVLRSGALVVAFAIAWATAAIAHSWYPIECCSGRDCMRVDRVERTPDGGMIMIVGRIRVQVPKGFTQRPSRDNDAHVCVRKNGDGSYVPRCVFIPAGV